jgi:hypothetical protein
VIVCLTLGDLAPEQQQFMGFQDQGYEDPNYSFVSNEAGVLKHITHIFSIYYVELELHDRNV